MRALTEETLRRALLWTEKQYHPLIQWFIDYGLEDINPWLPIDENTPKYKELLLYYPENDSSERLCRVAKYDPNSIRQPTHYQELPDDPKE